mmetsp:Transcript_29342/g.98227  ORF Transcript_29342/g.98227 Transcript_29342/m.98227 type:complete len:119 (+) Transcript_29342:372-728(+)
MLLRASEEERQRFTFAKLDVNRSGALERSDLVASMRRQLSIARTLSPLLVQLQLRRHTLTATELRQLGETAVAAAHETIDAMHTQVEPTVDELLASMQTGADGAVTLDAWRKACGRRR